LDGDGRLFYEWRVESKQTRKDKFLLTQAVWSKLLDGAAAAGEEPLLHVELCLEGNIARRCIVRRSWYDSRCAGDAYPAFISVLNKNRNRKSYKIQTENAPTPHLIQLVPEGIMLYESEFLELKEDSDGEDEA